MDRYIYILRSDRLDKVIKNYIDYITNPFHEWRQEWQPSMKGTEIIYNGGKGIINMPLCDTEREDGQHYIIKNLPKPNYETARRHIMAICNYIFRKYRNTSDDRFRLSSERLHKLSDNYKWICMTLKHMGIIDFVTGMKDHDTDRHTYNLYNVLRPELFHLINMDNIPTPIEAYIRKYDLDIEHQKHLENLRQIEQSTSPQFVKRYNQSLKHLTINSKDAIQYIKEHYSEPTDKDRIYRETIIHKINSKGDVNELSSLDENGRLYHIGTQLPRDLRNYTNIVLTIDCKNSHLLLFNYFIINHYIGLPDILYNIPANTTLTDTIYIISLILHKVPRELCNYNHIFADFIRNELRNSKIEKSKIAKLIEIPNDVWKYLWKSSHGKLWDDFVEKFSEERSTVKENVFRDVFYAYSTRNRNDTNSKYLNEFKTLYPNIYEIIVRIRKNLHQLCKEKGEIEELPKAKTVVLSNGHKIEYYTKDKILLPNLLMRLESYIFTAILIKLYHTRGFYCLGIHDAICVLNDKMSCEKVHEIMMKEYAKYGLIPTLDVKS